MKNYLLLIILSSLSVGTWPQYRSTQTPLPISAERFSAMTSDNALLQQLLQENPTLGMTLKYTKVFPKQINTAVQAMYLDSIVTRDGLNILSSKQIHLRDTEHRDTLIGYYNWNTATNIWDTYQKNQLTHDGNGNITSSTIKSVFGGFTIGVSKFVATFDPQNNQQLRTNYKWDFISSSWVFSTQTESIYDTQNKDTVNRDYSWVNNSWKFIGKQSFAYDGKGYKVREVDYLVNSATSKLDLQKKTEIMNDENGRDTLSTNFDWNVNTTGWDPTSKTKVVYNNNRMFSTLTSYDWNASILGWDLKTYIEYTLDPNGYIGVLTFFDWDTNTSDWVGSLRMEYTNDANGNLLVERTSMWNINTWDLYSVSNYYYTQASVGGINDISMENYLVYPIPATNRLCISGLDTPARISIVDEIGRVIYETEIQDNFVDLFSLSSGIYFMSIKTIKGNSVVRFIKE